MNNSSKFPSIHDLSNVGENENVARNNTMQAASNKVPPKPISISSGEESEVKVNVKIDDMA